MQVLDEQKRAKILAAAAERFSSQPFHKVLLSDVAAAAGVGKGTLYIYFKNKEDLYLMVLYTAFAQLVAGIRQRLEESRMEPMANLETAVREIVQFAFRNPHMFELMRAVSWRDVLDDARWDEKRRELRALIESIIRHGVEAGQFDDPHPELTAHFIPGLVRSVLIDGVQRLDPQTLTDHIVRFIRGGLATDAMPGVGRGRSSSDGCGPGSGTDGKEGGR